MKLKVFFLLTMKGLIISIQICFKAQMSLE